MEPPDIEVDTQMLDAGVAEYLTWDHIEDSPREIVAAIYRAMSEKEPVCRSC